MRVILDRISSGHNWVRHGRGPCEYGVEAKYQDYICNNCGQKVRLYFAKKRDGVIENLSKGDALDWGYYNIIRKNYMVGYDNEAERVDVCSIYMMRKACE